MTDCDRCRRPLRHHYQLRMRDGVSPRCLRCALLHPPLVARSFAVAAVVGTILTAINQGNVIIAGDATPALAWKIPLTYVVPYCVATLGALLNARVSSGF